MPEAAPLKIVYEDAALLVAEKAPGLASEGGGDTVLKAAERLGRPSLLVHRLDRETGGLMLLSRTPRAAAALSGLIAAGEVEKEYLAVVDGCPFPADGQWTDLLFRDQKRNKSYVVDRPRKGVREARLRYRLLAAAEAEGLPCSLVRVGLDTGRSHQIRVQFASRGMPLWGDRRYGSSRRAEAFALWSFHLSFRHPESGERLSFFSVPPETAPWTLFSDAVRRAVGTGEGAEQEG